MSFDLPTAQLLVQASAIAYESKDACQAWAERRGFDPASFEFFDNRGTQAFAAHRAGELVIAFRGTEPGQRSDRLADVRLVAKSWPGGRGELHHGFYDALMAVWAPVEARLQQHGGRRVWITGHSLGGALAQLCAAQARFVSKLPVDSVYTFGQPRVGTGGFATAMHEAFGPHNVRFVNDRDIVPRVPHHFVGYQQYGTQVFFDHEGAQSLKSGVEGFLSALGLAIGGIGIPDNIALRELFETSVENIKDHNVRECYMKLLQTSTE